MKIHLLDFKKWPVLAIGFFILFTHKNWAQIPALSSNSSSAYVLLLDMDGHTDNSGWWGSGSVVAASSGFSTSQATEVFNRVAEDFRAFDINVTTQQSVYDAAPVANRQRVVITPTDGWYNTGGTSAGGVAYIGTFGGGEIACWVFSNKLGGAANCAEASSHELGHTLGLGHQSRYNSNCTKNTEYHSGEGSGQTSWAPIMGVSYEKTISQWYNGPGNGSTCTSENQNDLSIITTTNGFNYRTDDVGNSTSNFTNISFSGTSVSQTGVISTNTDIDVFRINLPNSGVYRLNAVPFAQSSSTLSGANLDIKLTIQNEAGNIIASLDPTDRLNATGIFNLPAGNYFVSIDGSGIPNYVATGGIGPNDYGSIGQYTLTVSTETTCQAALVSTTSVERCGPGSVTLSVSPASGSSVIWYSTSGTVLGSQNNYTTPTISTSTTYYAEVQNGTCTSAVRVPVNAIISIAPTIPAITGPNAVQIGNIIQLSNTYSFGTWNSSNPNAASVSSSGLVTGLASGTSTISYSDTVGSCPPVSVSMVVTVSAPGPCPGIPTVTDADGNVYNTIQIGNQCWTKENLKTSKFADNSVIPGISLTNDWASLSSPAWSQYNNSQTSENQYGKLYNWYAVTSSKGLCPVGWHIPDFNEFSTASSFLNGSNVAGGKMKATTLWEAPNTGASNSSGFTAFGGGQRTETGTFQGIGTEAGFWTVGNSENGAFRFQLTNNSAVLFNVVSSQKSGQAVRCIKDDASGALPVINYIYASTSCGPGRIYLYAMANKGFINWYDAPTGGNLIFTGSSFQSPILSLTTTYYAEAVYGTNVSNPRTAVQAVIKPIFSPGILQSGDQSFCGSGDPGIISMSTQPVTGDSLRFQWYYRNGIVNCPSGSDTTGWIRVQGATGNSYDPPAGLSTSRTYGLFVTPIAKRSGGTGIGQPTGGTVCGSATWASSCRKVTINPNPVVTITPNGPTTFCEGGSVSLTASGASTYTWFPSGGSSSTITVNTSANYAVLGISAEACSTTASILVTVLARPTVSVGADQQLNANTGTVNLSGSPTGGTWTGTGISSGGSFNTQQTPGIYPMVYCFSSLEGCSKCDTMVITLVNSIPSKVATPVITPPTGTYSGPQTMSITCATPGAQIYFTTSGNNPVVGTTFTRLYNGPFQILQNTTIRAMGVLSGAANSNIAASFITLSNPSVVANPTISPNGGTHNGSVTVSLSTTPADAQIYYTTNGNTPLLSPFPNSFTRLYSGPFTLTATSTVRAIGVKSGLTNSGVSVANFTVNALSSVAPVVFSPSPGVYTNAQSISMTSATPDAVIYYTTNGNVPLLNPFPNSFTRIYSSPVLISASSTVRAIAIKSGMSNSPTAVGIYTISPARLAIENEPDLYYYFEENDQATPEMQQFEVFPNPVSDKLQIRLSGVMEENAELEMFDMKGGLVLKKDAQISEGKIFELETSKLPNGIYQLILKTSQQTFKSRVVK
jgi:uncharacterized protein (TIGR02145 family)